ncbi:hypothetical protein [Bradyrhizobium sp. Tv2a-2]|uniref:hypothetical protein n=1 Tax=Bradyrhizobium sp. Tv2a-2 TaxID=113395 RepID=UPI000418EAFF|nr:hypothetical protein [Bradyrhizobium sp. Tv2a-2]
MSKAARKTATRKGLDLITATHQRKFQKQPETITSAVPVVAAAMPTGDDAKLVALGRQISALRVLERASEVESMRCNEAYDQMTRSNQMTCSRKEALEHSGLAAAELAGNLISDQMTEVYKQMLGLRPTTLEGYRALALAIVENCWCDEINLGQETGDEWGTAVIISSLTGIPMPDDDGQASAACDISA